MKIFLMLLFALSSITIAQNPKWINYPNTKKIMTVKEEGNNIWIGTKGGLLNLNKTTGNITLYNRSNSGLPYNWVNSIAIDGSGNKWMGSYEGVHGTYGGLTKFDGTKWTVYNT